MTPNFLRTLVCPDCRKNFAVGHSYFKKSGNLIHAAVSCGCDNYPVVGGILFFKKGVIKDRAFLFLKQKSLPRLEEVPIFLLRLPLGNLLAVKAVTLATKAKIFKNLSFKSFMKFFIAIGLYEKKWGDYLLKRFANKSFFAGVVASSLIEKGSRVLDLASGAGHFLSILKRKTEQENITAVETSLPGIYLAQKYFCPNANFIYADMEEPLPFKEKLFDSVFVNDALHYIVNKARLGSEIVRVLKKGGFVCLSVLHNKKFKNTFVDPVHFPDTPSGYASYFLGLKYAVFSEENAPAGKLRYIGKKKAEEKITELRTFTLLLSQNNLPR